MKVIYIATPETEGDLKVTQLAAYRVQSMGFRPLLHPTVPWESRDWLSLCRAHIRDSDIVLRLPEMRHAPDPEIEFASSLNLPIAYGWTGLDTVLALYHSETTDASRRIDGQLFDEP